MAERFKNSALNGASFFGKASQTYLTGITFDLHFQHADKLLLHKKNVR